VQYITMEELLEAVSSVRSAQRLHNGEHLSFRESYPMAGGYNWATQFLRGKKYGNLALQIGGNPKLQTRKCGHESR
jgi:hypothetical protein